MINEFKILENIGKGAYSKVKRVVRFFTDEETGQPKEATYAMKVKIL